MIKLISRYVKKYTLQLVMVVVFSLLQVVCQLVLPQLTNNILKDGVGQGNLSYIYNAGMQMIVMTILVSLCMIACGYFSAFVTAKFTCSIRSDLFYKTRDFSEADYSRFGGSSLMNRTTADTTVMQMMMINSLRSALLVPFTGVGALIVAIRMNGQLTMVVLAAFVLTAVFLVICSRRSLPLFSKLQKKTDRINLLMKEKLTGVRSIRAFNRQKEEEERLMEADEEAYDTAIRANKAINYMTPSMQLIMNLTMVVIYYLSSVKIQNAMMDSADLLKFLQYILNFVGSLSTIVTIINFMPKATVSAQRVLEVLDYEPSVIETQNVTVPVSSDIAVEFADVAFRYEGAERNVLEGINFKMKKGTTTAVVGTTGAGKTTLVSLLLRFFDTTDGIVYVDGKDIRQQKKKELRDKFSYAPQRSMVLQKTIYENLKVANEHLSREDAMKALSLAQADEFVKQRPEGLDMPLAQNGMNVSGGQRQRLSLARMFARDADIYILDDSLSALDMKTDSIVRSNIRTFLKDKTVLMVAQRISTIMYADNIVVLEQGRIAGQGTHEELLNTCEAYREIYATQCYNKEGGNE